MAIADAESAFPTALGGSYFKAPAVPVDIFYSLVSKKGDTERRLRAGQLWNVEPRKPHRTNTYVADLKIPPGRRSWPQDQSESCGPQQTALKGALWSGSPGKNSFSNMEPDPFNSREAKTRCMNAT